MPDPDLLARSFGLEPISSTPLAGEVDLNYRIDTRDGARYLLKVADPASFDPTPIATHLHKKELPFGVPLPIAVKLVEGKRVSLQKWLPGRMLAEIRPRTDTLFHSWGQTCGQLSLALADLDLPEAHREYPWDSLQFDPQKEQPKYSKQEQKKLAAYFTSRLRSSDFSTLRKSVCYNDAHEHNLLVSPGDDRITGVIDFGDIVYTATVCELATACAYAGMYLPDPVHAMRQVVAGYQSVFPLLEEELTALYDLICIRLLLTVTSAARNAALQAENAYLQVSAKPAWDLLSLLREVHPNLALAHFRTAAGFPASPLTAVYKEWATTAEFHPVMHLQGLDFTPVDLSVGSKTLGNNQNFMDLPRFIIHFRRYLEDRGANLAIGGYGETRPIYTTDDFMSHGNQGPHWRSVHLGLDFWTTTADQPIFAPLAGIVERRGIDSTLGGYGHYLILRHSPTAQLTFYTLYGHLSPSFSRTTRAGTQVQAGTKIASLGSAPANGGWPPHLHFQVMLDLLGFPTDFPGVAYPEEADTWLGICPDPRTLLPVPVPAELPPPEPTAELLKRRKSRLGYSLSVSYDRPLQLLRGYKQYLYDRSGRRYLDTVNNVAHVGHEHPRVVAAASRQLAVLNTNSRYLHHTITDFADALVATLPDRLSVVHFTNSGSEANELALRMAEVVTGSRATLAMEMGYHGNTGRTVEVSSYKFDRPGGMGRPEDTFLLPLPDLLRDKHTDPTAHLPASKCSFIHESILSCGGQLMLPAGYLDKVYQHARNRGGLCIADEVQTGLGRVGDRYWAFELQGVVPDIVTIGKPIGNGHPLGAVVCTPEVAAAFANGMEYFNTFGGNPVSCAVGLEVLNIVADEGLMQRASDVGGYLTTLLNQLKVTYPIIADVRGSGLFLGVELCRNDFAPASAPAAYITNRMRDLGFLMSTDGPHENVLKIKPPMCFSRENADLLVHYLERTMREDGSERQFDVGH